MGNASSGAVQQHVESARKTGVCSLSGLKLKEFPADLLSLKGNLRTLDLSGNRLTALPPSLGELGLLRSLNMSSNTLEYLPESIGNLKKLETLQLSRNSLADLPDSLVNLKSLKTVNLSHNKLQSFPRFLCQLTKIDAVDLSGNLIAELPAGVECLNVVELNLNQNRIKVLPSSLAKCPRLKVLRVEENTLELKDLPLSILSESLVSLLCADGNLFLQRDLQALPEYQKYMERYTNTKRKVG